MMKKLRAKLAVRNERQALLNQIDALAGIHANDVLRAAIECAKNAVTSDQVESVAHLYWIVWAYELTADDVRAAGIRKAGLA